MRGNTQIEKQLRALRSTADTPRLSATDAAEIGDASVPAICGFLFPTFDPSQDHAQHVVETADGVTLSESGREGGEDIHSCDRNTHPKRAVMFKDNLHVGGLAQNANVWQHSVIHQIMSAHAVASVLAAAEFFPLRLFNFPSNRGKNDIALQSHSCPLQGL